MKPLPYVLRSQVPAEAAEDARRAALLAVVVAANMDLPAGQSIGTVGGGTRRHVVHRHDGQCGVCGGAGYTERCRKHAGAACDCVAEEEWCRECEGAGWREDEDCDCRGCREVAAALEAEAAHDGE